MTATEVEIEVARHFNYRANVIVPNVFWGMGLHYEADMVVLRPSGYAVEIEIKVSASDIKADLKKRNAHDSPLFRELWFAVPESLECHPDIPKRAGVLSIRKRYSKRDEEWYTRADRIRSPEPRKSCERWTDAQRLKLYSLGLMRVWRLKEKQINERERG